MILCLAGTSDARELAVEMKKAGYDVITSVVTDNAALELEKKGLEVRVGRLSREEFSDYINLQNIKVIVDASHPFAEEASRNSIQAAADAEIPYIRYERASQSFEDERITFVSSYEEAAVAAEGKKGVIMLTTGSKTLQIFTDKLLGDPDIRLVARMLPRKDNMEKCAELGFPQKDIVAMQGPFTKEFDKALYRQFGVTVMITKESGRAGSVSEKLEAAKELGIDVIVIRRPEISYGIKYSIFSDVLDHLGRLAPNIKRRQESGL
ncbi:MULTISPECIES: precorrin-6A reductase [Bacillaceae]|uniref:precorrin-6A reductase n=1 Tax=Bacillaceae TaxID=186817 RepID=UPI002964E67F|nr:precorrin-6A reductase [Bacillus infantis]MDW2876751.1 precorrin-6A reductase [Bacillus infantis]